MFDFYKQTFIWLLASIVNASSHIKCISLKKSTMHNSSYSY